MTKYSAPDRLASSNRLCPLFNPIILIPTFKKNKKHVFFSKKRKKDAPYPWFNCKNKTLGTPTSSIRFHTWTGQSSRMSYSFGNPFARKPPACNIPVILRSIRTPLFSFIQLRTDFSSARHTLLWLLPLMSLSPSPGPCALISELQSSATTAPAPLLLPHTLLHQPPFHYD